MLQETYILNNETNCEKADTGMHLKALEAIKLWVAIQNNHQQRRQQQREANKYRLVHNTLLCIKHKWFWWEFWSLHISLTSFISFHLCNLVPPPSLPTTHKCRCCNTINIICNRGISCVLKFLSYPQALILCC